MARERAAIVKVATRQQPFWLLVIAFTANGGAGATVAVLLITYLIRLGHPPVLAATLAGLLGVLSATGRLITPACRPDCPPHRCHDLRVAGRGRAAATVRPVRHHRLRLAGRLHRRLIRRRQGPGPFGAVALAQAAGYGWAMGAVAAACAIAAFALLAYHRL